MSIDILNIFNEAQVRQMGQALLGEFEAKCLEKRRWCADHGLAERLDQDHRDVLKLLSLCGNAYHVEALRRFILRDEVVPQWKHVEALANEMMTARFT